MPEMPMLNGDEGKQDGETIEEYREKIRDELALLQSDNIQINMPMLLSDCSRVALIKLMISKGIIDEQEVELFFQREVYNSVSNMRKDIAKQKLKKEIIVPGMTSIDKLGGGAIGRK